MALKKCKLCAVIAAGLIAVSSVPACGVQTEKIAITVGIWRGNSEQEKAYYEECVAEFASLCPQYEVSVSPYSYSEDTVLAKFASGKLPTVFEVDAVSAKSALRNGYIRDVSENLRQLGWDDKADAFFLKEISEDGSVCGIPAEQYATGMVLNLPLLAEAGVLERSGSGEYLLYDDAGNALYPDTFSELQDVCAALSASGRGGSLYLGTGDDASGAVFTDLVYNFGSPNLETDDGKSWNVSFTHEEFSEALRWVKSMGQNGYIDSTERAGSDGWAVRMSEGEVAFAFSTSDFISVALAAYPQLRGQIAFVPLPAAEGVACRSAWGGTVYAINGTANAEQTEGVLRFLAFLGYGPDVDETALSSMTRRISYMRGDDMPVYPPVYVWRDEQYVGSVTRLFSRYASDEDVYLQSFFDRFDSFRSPGEPYCRVPLFETVDGLFSEMIFNANGVNIVTLTEEREREFNEKYLSKFTG